MNFEGDWWKEIKPGDVPKSFQELVEVVGIEATVKLAIRYGGLAVYVPKPNALFEKKRNDMIRRDVRIHGYRETAVKYGLTEVWVRQICDHQKEADRQLDMFGD
jgi:Mor family transcriptional regulator